MAKQPIINILATNAAGERVLEAVSRPVRKADPAVIRNLKDTITHSEAYGVAAPQIGVFERIFVMSPSLLGPELILINPQIIATSQERIWSYEGCLSIDSIRLWVPRFSEVTVSYFDEKQNHVTRRFSGTGARVAQHEIDHLDGVTIFDRLQDPKRKESLLDRLETRSIVGKYIDFAASFSHVQPAYGAPFRCGAQTLSLTFQQGPVPEQPVSLRQR
ncbi:MAG: peptide deformylase [Alphaproteobacteria bacterium]|nr:peptide deformylase [Alphaproteobacteria bacterium]